MHRNHHHRLSTAEAALAPQWTRLPEALAHALGQAMLVCMGADHPDQWAVLPVAQQCEVAAAGLVLLAAHAEPECFPQTVHAATVTSLNAMQRMQQTVTHAWEASHDTEQLITTWAQTMRTTWRGSLPPRQRPGWLA